MLTDFFVKSGRLQQYLAKRRELEIELIARGNKELGLGRRQLHDAGVRRWGPTHPLVHDDPGDGEVLLGHTSTQKKLSYPPVRQAVPGVLKVHGGAVTPGEHHLVANNEDSLHVRQRFPGYATGSQLSTQRLRICELTVEQTVLLFQELVVDIADLFRYGRSYYSTL